MRSLREGGVRYKTARGVDSLLQQSGHKNNEMSSLNNHVVDFDVLMFVTERVSIVSRGAIPIYSCEVSREVNTIQ